MVSKAKLALAKIRIKQAMKRQGIRPSQVRYRYFVATAKALAEDKTWKELSKINLTLSGEWTNV